MDIIYLTDGVFETPVDFNLNTHASAPSGEDFF